MFTKTKDIDRAFRHIRAFSIVVIISCAVIAATAIYLGLSTANDSRQKVYILASGKVLEAYSSERKDNISVEARDHVATFHRLFFTLAPDEKVINYNISKALYLADASAKRQYENLRESGFFTGVVSGNVSQDIQIDSIQIRLDSHPYFFQCKAIQRIVRPTSVVSRSLVTEGYLRSVSRSDNNPHGFLIERWQTTENKDIHIQNR